jgi:hypothetical protein
MVDNALSKPISGDTQVAGTPSITAPGALYAFDVSTPKQKKPAPELLPPFGRETALWVKTIDEERRERDHHHQPLRQIHLSRTEICLKKRSHPCLPSLSVMTALAEVPIYPYAGT